MKNRKICVVTGTRANEVYPGRILNSQDSKFIEYYGRKVPMGLKVKPEEVCEEVL